MTSVSRKLEEEATAPNIEALVLYRSLYSFLPNFILFLICIALVVVINSVLQNYITRVPILRFLPPRLFSLLPLAVLLETVREYYDVLYEMNQNGVTKKEGRLSFRYSVPTIRYSDLRGIFVYQTFLGRLFNYGSVYLGTAAQADAELVMVHIDKPYEVSAAIEEMRDKAKEETHD
jgi:hypothetical protein